MEISAINHVDASGWSLAVRWKHGRGEEEAYFRTQSGPFSEAADPLVPLALLPAMAEGEDLHIRGNISPKLAGNIDAIQDLLHAFDGDLKKVGVTFDGTTSAEVPKRGGTAFFSGGVDSFYTVLKNRDALNALVFVRGFDVPRDRSDLFEVIMPRIREASASMSLPLVEIETNIRDVFDRFVDWTYFGHGAVQSALGLALGNQFGRVFLAGPYSYRYLTVIGSHPMLDPLWSADGVEIIHDGAEAPRVRKLIAISGASEVRDALRVCYYTSREVSYNCRECSKCVMTWAILTGLQLGSQFTSFPERMDLRKVLAFDTSDPIVRFRVQEVLQDLPEADGSREVRRLLEEASYRGATKRYQERTGEYHALPLSLLQRWPRQGRVEVKGGVGIVRSRAEAWAYSGKVGLPPSFLAEHGGSPAFLRLRMRVTAGRMGVGVTSASGHAFQSRAEVKASQDFHHVYLSVPALDEMGDVVVQNWNRPVEGEAEISSIEIQVVEPGTDLRESLARLEAASRPSILRRLTGVMPARARKP